MNEIELVRELMGRLSGSDPQTQAACFRVCDYILMSLQEDGKKVEKAKKTSTSTKTKSSGSKRGRKPFDTGKLKALREGGWSIPKIADEMKVSEMTIRNHMKKEGIA